MKKIVKLSIFLVCLSALASCVIGKTVGIAADVTGAAVSVGAKTVKAGAGVAGKAVDKTSTVILGDKDKKKTAKEQ